MQFVVLEGALSIMKNENQRIRLTKQLIKDSLIKLLDNSEISKISIKSICDTAEINRSTFYKYYGSQYDVLSEIEDFHILKSQQILGNELLKTNAEVYASLELFCSYLEENKKSYRIITQNTGNDFIKKILSYRQIQLLIINQLPDCYKKEDGSLICTFIVCGIYQILVEWLSTDCLRPSQEIAGLIHKLLNNICLK